MAQPAKVDQSELGWLMWTWYLRHSDQSRRLTAAGKSALSISLCLIFKTRMAGPALPALVLLGREKTLYLTALTKVFCCMIGSHSGCAVYATMN